MAKKKSPKEMAHGKTTTPSEMAYGKGDIKRAMKNAGKRIAEEREERRKKASK